LQTIINGIGGIRITETGISIRNTGTEILRELNEIAFKGIWLVGKRINIKISKTEIQIQMIKISTDYNFNYNLLIQSSKGSQRMKLNELYTFKNEEIKIEIESYPFCVKGASPKELYRYWSNKYTFNCTNSITKNMINDDYCDCLNGEDEPGTNACPNGKFYCLVESKYIDSSRIADKYCDCEKFTDEQGIVSEIRFNLNQKTIGDEEKTIYDIKVENTGKDSLIIVWVLTSFCVACHIIIIIFIWRKLTLDINVKQV